MEKFFDDFMWHSSIGIDNQLYGNKRFYTKLPNTKKAMSMFIKASDDFLIHKTTQALWRLSEDGGSIEPVFNSDVLKEEDLLGEE